MVSPIKVWRFYDAPARYRSLDTNDDADWLAFVPKRYNKDYIGWLESDTFGCCCINKHRIDNGMVYIGYHA